MIGRKFVMSDIHGCYDKMIEMLDKIDFNESDTLYILGDVVDRGPDPIKILQYIMKNKNIELILGNHERMFLDYLEDGVYESETEKIIAEDEIETLYLRNGGSSTIQRFYALPEAEQLEVEKFLKSIPLFKIVDKYILVHSGLSSDEVSENQTIYDFMSAQFEEDLLWIREDFYMNPAIEDYVVVFGHTPTRYMYEDCDNTYLETLKIWHDKSYDDKIGIDCGAVFGNHRGCSLACLCLDTLEEFYV